MHNDEALRTALDQVYEAFDSVPCPTHWNAAPERNGDALLRVLTSSPLRVLTGKQIGPYAGWAMTTVGSGNDYQYFLPRILEVAIDDPSWMGTMPQVIASRLKMAAWTEWPRIQRDAVFSVFNEAFQWSVQRHTDVTHAAPDWLCGLASLGGSIEPQLATWRHSSLPNAALQLACFVTTTKTEIADGDRSFWNDVAPSITGAVRSWLMSNATRTQLISSLGQVSKDDGWMIENALKLLQ
jgi:hypothetical protein